MKLLRALCFIALIVAITIPVYAETQSVKLSGDIIIRGIDRKNYDFNKWDANGFTPTTRDFNASDANYFMTTTEVQLDADLTDNVSATIRVVNQRDWNVRLWDGAAGHNFYVYPSDASGGSDGVLFGSNDEFKIDLDLAYITLKEFYFAPLTVKIGRQDLWFGKGFIIGSNGWQDPQHQLSGDEWSVLNAFDAIRATWDFAPWTLDGVYSMIQENDVGANDDVQLVGLNLGCDLKQYKNAEAELYYWHKNDRSIRWEHPQWHGDSHKGNTINTIGGRGSFDPHEAITLWGEVAGQFGEYVADRGQGQARDRRAWAADLGGEVRLWENQYAWKPKVGIEYIFYSGQDDHIDGIGHPYKGWDRMYRGKVDSAIHEWYNVLYTNHLNPSTTPNDNDRGDTNLHQLILMGSLQPMDNLKLNGRWIMFRLDENGARNQTDGWSNPGHGQDEKGIGNELDLELNYDYTEDVSFGLLSAWFWAGDFYWVPEKTPHTSMEAGGSNSKAKDVATELVGTCKVSF